MTAIRLFSVWDRLRTSFWFLPSAMAVVAIALSFLLVRVDTMLGAESVREFGFLYTFGPEGARAILSAIGSSMITVAGLTFSITMLTLQLASSQFGPRLLRNFMRDRGNQVVLGTFIATFVYCLLVLRTVRGTEGASFVPHIAVAFGVLLAIASIAVLIYFIHHVATAIRIETLLVELADETHAAIARLYPDKLGQAKSDSGSSGNPRLPEHFETGSRQVPSGTDGYVQRLDADALMQQAMEHDLIVRIDARPGCFVTRRDPVLSAYPAHRVSDDIANRLRAACVVGQERTPEQDLSFSLRRIVEIAQRALSPGINDPTTALYCIDRLGEALAHLCERDMPSPLRQDDDGHLRIATEVVSVEALASETFASIARYGIADADVVVHLVTTLDMLRRRAPAGAARVLQRLSEEITTEGMQKLVLACDRRAIQAQVDAPAAP